MKLIIDSTDNNKLKQHLLWVGVTTLVTVIFWIGYAIYDAYTTITIDNEIEALITPLNPTLDQETLNQVANRFSPPENYTILVKIQNDDDTQTIVPLGTNTPIATASPTTSPASTTSASQP